MRARRSQQKNPKNHRKTVHGISETHPRQNARSQLARIPCIIDTNGRSYNNWRFVSPDGGQIVVTVNGPIDPASTSIRFRLSITSHSQCESVSVRYGIYRIANTGCLPIDDALALSLGLYLGISFRVTISFGYHR